MIRSLISFACVAALWLSALPALAQEEPVTTPILENNTDFVLDKADVLSPETEAALEAQLREISERSGIGFILITLADLKEQDSGDLSAQAAIEWATDKPRPISVAALVLAPNERELSYSTASFYPEGVLTEEGLKKKLEGAEVFAQGLEAKMNETVVPFFAVDAWEGGVKAYVDMISTEYDAFEFKLLDDEPAASPESAQ